MLRGAAALMVLMTCGPAWPQATVKRDGHWRALLSLGAAYASGNSQSKSLNFNGEAVHATLTDKWVVHGRTLYTKSDGQTTAEQLGAGTRYDWELGRRWFGFGQTSALRDRPANLNARISASVGNGYHVIDTAKLRWDGLLGLGYSYDHYTQATLVADQLRLHYGRAEAILGEESAHQLSDTAKFTQKLTLYPDLQRLASSRAEFDSSLSTAITKSLNLTASLVYRYNNDPGAGLSQHDTQFTTGVSWPIE